METLVHSAAGLLIFLKGGHGRQGADPIALFRFDLGQYDESRVLLKRSLFLLVLRDGELQRCAGKIIIAVVVRGSI